MLVITAKLTRRKMVAGVVMACFLFCGIIFCLFGSDVSKTVSGEISVPTVKIKSAEARLDLLKSFGLEVVEEPVEFREIMIPEEFDETYTEYNELQKSQGFNLEKYAGKRVMKYSYAVLNHPSGEEGVTATLLVYKGKLIGGDVASAKSDGFMNGLLKQE